MVQTVAERVAEDLAGALEAIQVRLRPRFDRAEPRRRARVYLRGLLGGHCQVGSWRVRRAILAA